MHIVGQPFDNGYARSLKNIAKYFSNCSLDKRHSEIRYPRSIHATNDGPWNAHATAKAFACVLRHLHVYSTRLHCCADHYGSMKTRLHAQGKRTMQKFTRVAYNAQHTYRGIRYTVSAYQTNHDILETPINTTHDITQSQN